MKKIWVKCICSFVPKKSWRRKIKNRLADKVILKNSQGNDYEFIHIIHNDKYSAPMVHLINKYFDMNRHCFMFCGGYDEKSFKIPEYPNVYKGKIWGMRFNPEKVKKFILNGLFAEDIVDWLYVHQEFLPISYWLIWGGDLYTSPKEEKNEFVRRHVHAIATTTDKQVYFDRYGEKPTFHFIFSPPVGKEILDSITPVQKDYIQVQVNNSADKSTIEVLKTLEKFKDENITVTTILSYGDMPYKDQILEIGQEIFGEKFKPVLSYMSESEYAAHLAQNDILILNQNRQQGFGNITASFYLGKKVFMRQDVSQYGYYQEMDVKAYSTQSIKEIDFKTFIEFPEETKKKNKAIIQNLFEEKYIASLWQAIFDA